MSVALLVWSRVDAKIILMLICAESCASVHALVQERARTKTLLRLSIVRSAKKKSCKQTRHCCRWKPIDCNRLAVFGWIESYVEELSSLPTTSSQGGDNLRRYSGSALHDTDAIGARSGLLLRERLHQLRSSPEVESGVNISLQSGFSCRVSGLCGAISWMLLLQDCILQGFNGGQLSKDNQERLHKPCSVILKTEI